MTLNAFTENSLIMNVHCDRTTCFVESENTEKSSCENPFACADTRGPLWCMPSFGKVDFFFFTMIQASLPKFFHHYQCSYSVNI